MKQLEEKSFDFVNGYTDKPVPYEGQRIILLSDAEQILKQALKEVEKKAIAVFQRYIDTEHEYPEYDWDDKKIKQYESDKKFINEVYEANKHRGFLIAKETAEIEFFKSQLKNEK